MAETHQIYAMDANVLLRYLLGDNEELTAKASAISAIPIRLVNQ